MVTEIVPVPPNVTLSRAAEIIESCAETRGLRITMRGTLAQHPGSIHWHLKRGRDTGTLEITLLNRERRVLLAVQSGRTGEWTSAALDDLNSLLTASFNAEIASPPVA